MYFQKTKVQLILIIPSFVYENCYNFRKKFPKVADLAREDPEFSLCFPKIDLGGAATKNSIRRIRLIVRTRL